MAFRKAHAAANSIYDAPPKTVNYPSGNGNKKLVTFTLCDTAEGTKVYRASPKVGGWWPMEAMQQLGLPKGVKGFWS